jgi:hypothetical protein
MSKWHFLLALPQSTRWSLCFRFTPDYVNWALVFSAFSKFRGILSSFTGTSACAADIHFYLFFWELFFYSLVFVSLFLLSFHPVNNFSKRKLQRNGIVIYFQSPTLSRFGCLK